MMGEEEKEQRADNIGSDTDSWKLEQCGGCWWARGVSFSFFEERNMQAKVLDFHLWEF